MNDIENTLKTEKDDFIDINDEKNEIELIDITEKKNNINNLKTVENLENINNNDNSYINIIFKIIKTCYSLLSMAYYSILFRFIILILGFFLHFWIFSTNPLIHSITSCHIPVIGQSYSMVFTKWPGSDNVGYTILKLFLILLFIYIGAFIGRYIIHHKFFKNIIKMRMFGGGTIIFEDEEDKNNLLNDADMDQGTWIVMLITIIFFLYISSFIYNLFINDQKYEINSNLNESNENVWWGIGILSIIFYYILLLNIFDLILQEYPMNKKSLSYNIINGWKNGLGGLFRIIIYWLLLIIGIIIFIILITTNENFKKENIANNETMFGIKNTHLSRTLIIFIVLLINLIIITQDKNFPTFFSGFDIRLPGLTFELLSIKLKYPISLTKILKPIFGSTNSYIIFSGKFLTYFFFIYLIIFDLEYLRTMEIYQPNEFGQCIHQSNYMGISDRIFSFNNMTTINKLDLKNLNRNELDNLCNNIINEHELLYNGNIYTGKLLKASYNNNESKTTNLLTFFGFLIIILFFTFILLYEAKYMDEAEFLKNTFKMRKSMESTKNLLREGSRISLSLSDEENKNKPLYNTRERDRAIRMFNLNPKRGIPFIMDSLLKTKKPKKIAYFIYHTKGLNKDKLGEFLGGHNELNTTILNEFAHCFDFSNKSFENSIREYLSKFRLPGESAQIDRIMEAFSNSFWEQQCKGKKKHEIFDSIDAIHILAFSTIMLNTDAHNPNLDKNKRMSKEQYISNLRGVNGKKDFPREVLEEIYDNISKQQILTIRDRDDEGNLFTDPVKVGYMKKQGGKLKAWRKRYFILSNQSLYYFTNEDSVDPLGFFPLEMLTVMINPHNSSIVELLPIHEGGLLKSVKYKHGKLVLGRHKKCLLQVEDAQEALEWRDAIYESIANIYADIDKDRYSIIDKKINSFTDIEKDDNIDTKDIDENKNDIENNNDENRKSKNQLRRRSMAEDSLSGANMKEVADIIGL